MAKFKPARAKSKSDTPSLPTRQGIPCLVLLVSGIILTMLLLFWVLKNAS